MAMVTGAPAAPASYSVNPFFLTASYFETAAHIRDTPHPIVTLRITLYLSLSLSLSLSTLGA